MSNTPHNSAECEVCQLAFKNQAAGLDGVGTMVLHYQQLLERTEAYRQALDALIESADTAQADAELLALRDAAEKYHRAHWCNYCGDNMDGSEARCALAEALSDTAQAAQSARTSIAEEAVKPYMDALLDVVTHVDALEHDGDVDDNCMTAARALLRTEATDG